jgi:serine/threonine protein kinase
MHDGTWFVVETAATPRRSFGRYQLVRHLASGGMAEVMLARVAGIERFERYVVIKRIRDEQARDARFVQMFLDEARLAASLHHHNIVHVHDIGQDDGDYFFAMEYVHGEDLRKLLMEVAERDGRVPLDHCVTIALSTAAALHHAHELRGPDRKLLGIVHRDVSPANILVGYDGNVKVVDFGIAKVSEEPIETQTGLMKGKVAYMSPEQCIGVPVDRRSDVFCLGIVLYELVTVRRLFKGANDFLTMSSITHGEIPPPATVRADIPPALEQIIMKALAMRPEDRYQTADAMRADLEKFAREAKLQSSVTALADYMREVFGDKQMPWLVEDDEEELSIDFDGSGSGVVAAPVAALQDLPSSAIANPQSPLMRARTKAITGAPPVGAPVPIVAAAATSSALASRAHRRAWLYSLGAAAAILVIGLAVVFARSDAPAPAPAAPVAPIAQPAAAPVVEPPPAVEATPPSPEPAVEAASAGSDSEPTKKKRRKRIKGVWDPKSLMPPKKK